MNRMNCHPMLDLCVIVKNLNVLVEMPIEHL